MKLFAFAVLSGTLMGCASAPPASAPAFSTTRTTSADVAPEAKPAPTPAPAAAAASIAEPQPEPIPTACGSEQSIRDAHACLPPSTFAKKLCEASYPDMALTMFAKGTPWTRVWLAGDVEAWNASGGFTSRAQLAFDEEVIVLSRHSAPGNGGMVITGAGASFDVLRWDGSCVSVQEGELVVRRPPQPKPATISWSRLEEGTKRALLTSPKVKSSRDALDKACDSAKPSCGRAEKDFSAAISNAVRSGAQLPTPTRRPATGSSRTGT